MRTWSYIPWRPDPVSRCSLAASGMRRARWCLGSQWGSHDWAWDREAKSDGSHDCTKRTVPSPFFRSDAELVRVAMGSAHCDEQKSPWKEGTATSTNTYFSWKASIFTTDGLHEMQCTPEARIQVERITTISWRHYFYHECDGTKVPPLQFCFFASRGRAHLQRIGN